MLSSGLPPLLLFLTALEPSWSLSDEEKKIILDGHNKYRSQVSPPAMDMLKMTWDTELEAFAQAYAEKCIWDHNKERGRRGENLFAMAPTLDLEFAVEDWNAEEKYYNLTTTTCLPGQMCGHYTQVVWASTHQIGCGSKFCEKIEGIETEDMYLLVCNYYPPGNMKGRKPYKEGPSCSQCPEGRVCVNSLCGNSREALDQQFQGKPTPTTMAKPAPTTPKPITTTTTTAKPAPTTPTPTATTTTAKPAPTTPKPTTTVAKPKPATSKPTPTTPTPTTTTAKPTPAFTASAKPKLTTTTSAPTTTAKTEPKIATTTKPEPTETERHDPTEATGLTLSFEPTLDLDYKVSPEVDTGEPVSPLTTEDPALLESVGTAFSPRSVPGTDKGVKEDGKEKSAFSSPSPSLSQIVPESKLGFNKTELIMPSKSVVFSPEEPTFLRLTSSSKEKKGKSPAFQTSLSGKELVESVLAWTLRRSVIPKQHGECLGGTSIKLVLWILLSYVAPTLFLTLSSSTEGGQLDVLCVKHGFVSSLLPVNPPVLSRLVVSWCTSPA
uniref:Peptidase inhibitor 16 n=1 Tax=Calidris pygmaea TaxID=425635 RepID=A0A8C3KQI7_9CHAR